MSSSAELDKGGRGELLARVEDLKKRLAVAESQLEASNGIAHLSASSSGNALHQLLLLGDSALPLGSFAFSSGLESFLAHKPRSLHTVAAFRQFLDLSVGSIATLNLPYVAAAFTHPESLHSLDNDLDASINCTVARRASVAQGRALLSVWDRSFKMHTAGIKVPCAESKRAIDMLAAFGRNLKAAPQSDSFDPDLPNGHFPPLFGVVSTALQLTLKDALYVFLLSHVKTLISAAVRASVLGPYQAQSMLAAESLQIKLWEVVTTHIRTSYDQSNVSLTGQSVPMLDLWGGRHEIIYSRIFNS